MPKNLDELIEDYEAIGYIRTCGPAKETRLGDFFGEAALFLLTPVFFAVVYATPIALKIRSLFHDDFENGINYSEGNFSLPNFLIKHYDKQARRYLERFIQNNPDDKRIPEAHYSLGTLYWGGEDNKRALEQFKQAIEQDHNHFRAHQSLIFCGKDIYDELVEYFQKAVADNPDYVLGHLSLGMLHEEKSEIEKAVEAYKKACPYPVAHYKLGNLYFEKGLDKEAFTEFIQTTIKPSEPESSLELEEKYDLEHLINMRSSEIAIIIQRHSDDMSFVDICEHTINSHSTNTAPYHCLGSAYRRKGMLEKAIETYQRILEFEPDNPDVYETIADTYAMMGESQKAIDSYMKRLEVGGYNGVAIWRIGQILYNGRQYEDALDVWKKLSKQDLFLTKCYGDMAMGEAITRADLVKKAKEKLRK